MRGGVELRSTRQQGKKSALPQQNIRSVSLQLECCNNKLLLHPVYLSDYQSIHALMDSPYVAL